jgi:hypothetical protein
MLHNLLVFLLDGQDENVPKNAEWYRLNFILCIFLMSFTKKSFDTLGESTTDLSFIEILGNVTRKNVI